MFSAFLTGFFLGLSLIVAIGAQNAFVLRQGILRKNVFYIALFCSISDAILIILGIVGISYFLNEFINEFSKIIFGMSALWLVVYGCFRVKSVFRTDLTIINNNSNPTSLINATFAVAIFTFANPHVYLDTIILIGSISQQFDGLSRVYFALGACIASFVWFFGIAFGASLLYPFSKEPKYWRIIDIIIAIIMFILAFNLATQGGWI